MKKLSKKMLALLLSVLMVLTVIPMGAFLATADEARDHYLFAYFTGNSTEQQKVKFAVSEDGLHYNALNSNRAIVNQTVGTGCARDPYIFIGQDGKYYIIVTDMDASLGWWDNSNTMAVFRSDDLVNWDEQVLFDMYDMYTQLGLSGTIHCTWAPQVIWDADANKYMIYFALADTAIANSNSQVMYYMYAADLMDTSTWEAPQELYRASQAAIDGDIMYNDANSTYYMYYKDESQATICYCTAPALTGPYTYQGKAISTVSDALEGCNCFYRDGKLTMFADAYNNGYFVVAESDDFVNWTVLDQSEHNIKNLTPRHGSVINITESEYDALVAAFGISTDIDVFYNFDRDFKVSDYRDGENGWVYEAFTDSNGYTYDLCTEWSAKMNSTTRYLSLLNGSVYINDVAVRNIMASKNWTVTFDASVVNPKGSTMVALTSGADRFSTTDWFKLLDNGEFWVYDGSSLTKVATITIMPEVEYAYALTYNGSTMTLYQNGKQVYTGSIGDVFDYSPTAGTNYLAFGFTDTQGGSRFYGNYSKIRVRETVLTASQVLSETVNMNNMLIYQENSGTETVNNRSNITSCGSGITTTYTGGYGASYTIATYVNPGSAVNGNSALIEFGNGGTDNSKQYLTLREDGTINFCWGDGTNPRYIDIFGNSPFTANTWHLVQINVMPQGEFYFIKMWVDGNENVSGNSDTGSGYCVAGGAGHSYGYDYSPQKLLNQSVPLKFGTGTAYWGANASYIDDFRVYGKAFEPQTIKNKMEQDYATENMGEAEESGNSLTESIAIYEARIAKMANSGYSKMYTNLSAAYTAYKAAIAARDTATTIDDAEAYTNLKAALDNMKPFVEKTGTYNPSGTNFTPEGEYYSNIIYSEGGNSDGEHGFDDNISAEIYEKHGIAARYGSWAYLYYPATVLLYDGKNTPKIPVVVGFRNNDNRYAVEVLQVGTDMSDFGLNEYWTGYDNSTTFKWPEANNNQFRSDDLYAEAKGNGMWTPSDGNTTSYYLVKNSLSYTAVPTSAYTCYSSTVWNIRSAYTYINDHYINDTITNAVPDIDVINYKKLIDALSAAANNSTNKGYLGDLVEKYQYNGLEGIFAAFDSATSLDPMTGSTYFSHTYAYNGEGDEAMDQAALLCGNDIDASVKLLNEIKITTESANYERLCAAMTAYEEKMASMTSPYTNLEAAYEAYVLAVEYKDAYEFGGRETFENPTLAIAAQNLEEATDNMKSMDEVTFTGSAWFNASVIPDEDAMAAGSTDNAGFNNILYCSSTTQWTEERDWNSAYNRFGIPKVSVIVVDGNKTPTLPVGFTHRKKSGNYGIYYVRTETADFELRSYWKGYNNYNTKYHYNTSGYDGRATGYEENYVYSTSCRSGITHNNTSTGRQWVNKMFYTGTGGTTTNGSLTDYYRVYDNMQFALATTRNNNYNSPWINNNNDNAEKLGTVYVINYKALKDKVDAIEFDSIDVTKYREGGLKTDENKFKDWLATIDAITGVDPKSFFINMDDSQVTTRVNQCATDIKNACDAADDLSTTPPAAQNANTHGDIYDAQTGELKPISNDNGAYTNLKIAILEAAQKTEQGCITNTPWENYLEKLAAAKAGMADIANANTNNYTDKQGYNSTAYSAAAINALATDLDNAIQALSNPNNTAHPLKFSYREVGTHAMWFQCNNNNAHEVYHHDNTAETIVPADGAPYDAMAIVYKTLDKTKYNDFSIIAAGKQTFDEVKTIAHSTESAKMMSLGETEKAQTIVDDGITALLTAINESNEGHEGLEAIFPNDYTITFNVYEIDNTGAIVGNTAKHSATTTKTYGLTETLNVSAWEEWDPETYEVQYWDVGGHRVNTHEAAITVNSQADIEVNVFVKEAATDTKLIIRSTSDKDFYTINVTADTTISIKEGDVNTLIINGNERRVPDSLTYQITGWHINFKPEVVTELAEGTTVGDLIGTATELVLKPEKLWKYGSKDTVYPFTVDGVAVADGAVPYDYHLRVNAGTADSVSANWTYGGEVYGIAFFNSDNDIFVPVTYGNSYRFWVNRDMDFYTIIKADGNTGIDAGYYLPAVNTSTEENGYQPFKIADEETMFYLDGKLPMVYSYAEPTGAASNPANRWTTRSAFTAAVGGGSFGAVTITECGTLYTANAAYIGEQNLVIENVGTAAGMDIFQKVNNNRDADSNQYSWSTTNPTGTAQMLYTRAYVKYSYTYRDTKIDAIAYGPVNACEFSAASN